MKLKFLNTVTLLIGLSSHAQTNTYLKIEDNYTERKYLVNNIIPNKPLLYWKYVEKDKSNSLVAREFGNKKVLLKYKIVEPEKGFFFECLPSGCFSYIIYVDKSGLHYVTSEKSLLLFIGKIDNLSEVLLVGRSQSLWVDKENDKGGSYMRTNQGYELNLMKYQGCPEIYESIHLKIDFKGKFTIKSNGVYKETGNCIVN